LVGSATLDYALRRIIMAFSLSDCGWEALVCPPSLGTAGYTVDDNTVFAGAVADTEQMIMTFPVNDNVVYLGTGYGRLLYCLYDINGIKTSAIPIFGKKACQLGGIGGLHGAATSSNTFTFSLWLYRGATFKVVCGTSSITITDSITPNINGVNQPAVTTGMILNQWYFVRLVCINGAMSCYVNGVLKGTTSFITNILGGTFIQAIDGVVHIKDVVICKVARDGSFVPTNILGY